MKKFLSVIFIAFILIVISKDSLPYSDRLPTTLPKSELTPNELIAYVNDKKSKEVSEYDYVTSKEKGEFFIDIPKLNIHNFGVQRGVGDEQAQLEVGGSLLQGTPYPNSREGNAVIGAHRVWKNDWNPFYYIDHLTSGDIVKVYIDGQVLDYEVFNEYLTSELDVDRVTQDFGFPALTLYSCTIEESDNRYVIHLKLID